MKNLIPLLLVLLSCSKQEIENKSNLYISTLLPIGQTYLGEPDYMLIVIDGIEYKEKVHFIPTAWKTTNGIELEVESHLITSLDLYSKEGVLMYQGVGYYDLEVTHYLNENNPIKLFKSVFNDEIGIGVTVFPNIECYKK